MFWDIKFTEFVSGFISMALSLSYTSLIVSKAQYIVFYPPTLLTHIFREVHQPPKHTEELKLKI